MVARVVRRCRPVALPAAALLLGSTASALLAVEKVSSPVSEFRHPVPTIAAPCQLVHGDQQG